MSARRLVLAVAVAVVATVMTSSAGATSVAVAPGDHPWIVTLCKFTDLSTEPATYTPSYFNQLYAGTGYSGVLDFQHWWREISYNNIDVAGTKVTTQWYSLGMTRYEWAGLNRYDKIKSCANAAAGDANIGNDFSKYYGVIATFNDDVIPGSGTPARVANTTVPAALNASDTAVNVASSAGFPAPPFAVTINDGTTNDLEELHVTGVSGTTWTVTRGYENFNPANAHNAGAAVSLIDGGDLGASGLGAIPVTINSKNYTLGMVVLPPETNMGSVQHETGHGFGYDHSRALSTATTDYNDCYDIMSWDSCNFGFVGDFGAAGVLGDATPAKVGPGLDAINLDIQGWMPAGRTSTFTHATCAQTTRGLAALNHPEAVGDMEVRIPATMTIPLPTPPGGTTSTDYYTLELRDKSAWDRAIPQNSVLIHLHGLNGFSYWVDQIGGSAVGHSGAFYLGDEYVDTPNNVVVAITGMNAAAHTATVAIAGGAPGGAACKIGTTFTYTGDTTADFNDSATLAGDLTVSGTSVPVPNAPVTLTLGAQSCSTSTNASGHASCSLTIAQHPGLYSAVGAYAGDAAFGATTGSAAFTITREESLIAYGGALTQDYHDPFTASATLVDPDGGAPIAGKGIVFTLGAGDSCGPVATDGSGFASCTITPTQKAQTTSIVASFAGDIDYLPSTDTDAFVITKEETTTVYTGPTVVLQGASGVTLSAQLYEDASTTPFPSGQAITLSIGAQSCIGTTDASGAASCAITFTGPLGPEPLAAVFAGDDYYLPSSDTGKTAIVFAFPSRGVFVIGDGTAGTSTTWWGAHWSTDNVLTGGVAPPSFKGFADAVPTLPTMSPATVCGTTFTTDPGNSPAPPGDVPAYMGVIVASSVSKVGSTISGTWWSVVVVRTDAGYAGNPGHTGTGTIVATFCP
ncbi:MAG: hypothetical protein ABI990_04730 [Actinomycetota bacterium]